MAETVPVLEHDPDLAEDLSGEDLALARERVRADLVRYPTGPWPVGPDDFEQTASFGLLLVDGLFAREVTVAEYTCAELLGPGDVLQPWLRIGPEQSVATEIDWTLSNP